MQLIIIKTKEVPDLCPLTESKQEVFVNVLRHYGSRYSKKVKSQLNKLSTTFHL